MVELSESFRASLQDEVERYMEETCYSEFSEFKDARS